jgi:hypothetical protein
MNKPLVDVLSSHAGFFKKEHADFRNFTRLPLSTPFLKYLHKFLKELEVIA